MVNGSDTIIRKHRNGRWMAVAAMISIIFVVIMLGLASTRSKSMTDKQRTIDSLNVEARIAVRAADSLLTVSRDDPSRADELVIQALMAYERACECRDDAGVPVDDLELPELRERICDALQTVRYALSEQLLLFADMPAYAADLEHRAAVIDSIMKEDSYILSYN